MARSRGKNGEINKEEDQGNSEASNVTKESNKAVAGARKKDTIRYFNQHFTCQKPSLVLLCYIELFLV